jgi:hypothetical protein
MPTKQFHISDVLSITTGRLVSTRHMTGVYDLLAAHNILRTGRRTLSGIP